MNTSSPSFSLHNGQQSLSYSSHTFNRSNVHRTQATSSCSVQQATLDVKSQTHHDAIETGPTWVGPGPIIGGPVLRADSHPSSGPVRGVSGPPAVNKAHRVVATGESFVVAPGNVRRVASSVHQQPTFQFRLAVQHPIDSAIDDSARSAQPRPCRGGLVRGGGRGPPTAVALVQCGIPILGRTFASVRGSPFLPRIGFGVAAGLPHQFGLPTISGTLCLGKLGQSNCRQAFLLPAQALTSLFPLIPSGGSADLARNSQRRTQFVAHVASL